MPLLIVISGILLLFVLIARFKLDAFISFITVCIFVGLFQGMQLQSIVESIQKGIGDTLGFLVLILGFGAMLGKLVADSGAAQRITSKLIASFGIKYIQWAVVVAGFIVGVPMFYSVGFVILIPLVFTVAASSGLPLIYVGLPMLASLSVTHGFLPPHPAPTAISSMFNADIGKTLLYGIIVAIPSIIIAGPLFSRTIKNINATPLKEFYNPVILKDEEMPGMGVSIFTALLPVILIIFSSVFTIVISSMFNADIGKTLLYGIIVAIPSIIIAGPLFSRTIKNINATPLKEFYNPVILKDEEMPGMGVSIFTALLPVILIIFSSVFTIVYKGDSMLKEIIEFIGNPVIAMLISVLVAIYTLGLSRKKKMKELMGSISSSVSSITMILLIISGAGALKQILIDSGVSDYIGSLLDGSQISPLILAWLIATVIRVCVGSATVAGLTAAGIVLPLISNSDVSPELMVLAIGSGSLMLSHVNDAGFWMFKEYFNLTVKETLSTWTVMETIVGITGLIGVLILNIFI